MGPRLYVHGVRDMLATDVVGLWVDMGSTNGSRTSLTRLPFNPVPRPSFTETLRSLLAAWSRENRARTSKALNT